MKKSDRNALVAFPVVVLIGAGVAVAGSQGGATAFGDPGLRPVQSGSRSSSSGWPSSPPISFRARASTTSPGASRTSPSRSSPCCSARLVDLQSLLLLALVVIWAARLGSYLFRRIRRSGKDARFDAIKPSFIRFLNAWTLQGLWVSLTLAAALAAITTTVRKDLGVVAIIGLLSGPPDSASRRRPTSEEPLPRGPGEQGHVHPQRSVGLVAPPQLFRGDHAVDRRGADRPARPAGLAVRHADLAGVRHPPAHPRQRGAAAWRRGPTRNGAARRTTKRTRRTPRCWSPGLQRGDHAATDRPSQGRQRRPRQGERARRGTSALAALPVARRQAVSRRHPLPRAVGETRAPHAMRSISAVLVGLPAAGLGVTQVLPAAIAAYDAA